MWTVFKVFAELVTTLLVFLLLAVKQVRSQLPEQGQSLHPLHWEVVS